MEIRISLDDGMSCGTVHLDDRKLYEVGQKHGQLAPWIGIQLVHDVRHAMYVAAHRTKGKGKE